LGRWPDTKLNLKNQEVNEFLTVLKTLDITVFSLMLLPMSRPQGLPGIPSETTYVAACITTGGVPKGPGSREEPGGARRNQERRGATRRSYLENWASHLLGTPCWATCTTRVSGKTSLNHFWWVHQNKGLQNITALSMCGSLSPSDRT
jgi:hypothetical protein